MGTTALLIATLGGTALQLLMVMVGHVYRPVMKLYAPGGMAISLAAGAAYAMLASSPQLGQALAGGLVAGGACAFVGIVASVLMKDVPVSLIGLGTASSVVTGLLGGGLGHVLAQRLGSGHP
jgi:hypothetical protein